MRLGDARPGASGRRFRWLLRVMALVALWPCALAAQQVMPASRTAQASGIDQPLTDRPGDAVRGRLIVMDRRLGQCLLCHSGPFPEQRLQGDLASDLRGVGARRTAAQLRQQLVDARRNDLDTLMPSYFSTEDLVRVTDRWRGRTLLEAQQIEDVLAFLLTLRETGPGS